jgi:hypothetical protein
MRIRSLFGVAVLLASAGIAHAQDTPPGAANVRTAVERSLPFLEKEGVAWMKDKGCAVLPPRAVPALEP